MILKHSKTTNFSQTVIKEPEQMCANVQLAQRECADIGTLCAAMLFHAVGTAAWQSLERGYINKVQKKKN